MKLAWNALGKRFFEAGIDRGVLYVDGFDGVPWNGLVSVSESPSGSDVKSYYIDGIKYFIEMSDEEFEATIEAYTYPDEFAQCIGEIPVNYGLYATMQPSKSFGLAYRTKVGNDVDGVDHAYKIHLIYGAYASSTDHQNTSFTDTIDPDNFSWKLVTKSPEITGYKNTSHFIIDSREAPLGLMNEIEDILYGSDDAAPRLPDADELIYLFEVYGSSIFDAGTPIEEYFATFDGGPPVPDQDSTIDGGTP